MIRRRIGLIVYGPPDWIVERFDTRSRRAFGFWTIVFSIIGSFFWGRELLFLTIISIFALVPNYLSETPVETEEKR